VTWDPSRERVAAADLGYCPPLSREDVPEVTASLQCRFSSVVGDGLGGVSSVTDGRGGNGLLDVVGLGHDGSGHGLPHDGLALDGDGDGDVVRSINMDGSGDLDDLLGVEGSVIGSVVWLLDEDGVLNLVDLLLDLDDGSVDSLGSLEDGGDGDGKVRGGGLEDPGGVAGDVAGLSEVDLLGDDRGGLVDGGDALGLAVGGVRSRSGGLGVGDGVGDDGPGGVVLRSVGGDSRGSSGGNCQGGSHQVGGGSESTSQDKGKGHKRSHDARYLLLSC